jgi:hypothetical protein
MHEILAVRKLARSKELMDDHFYPNYVMPNFGDYTMFISVADPGSGAF